jgi:protein-disulfide isomerase
MKRRAWAGAALVFPAAVLLLACGDGDDDSAAPARTATRTAPAKPGATSSLAAKVQAIDSPKDLATGRKLGKADAKVTLVMFEDFTCSHCLEFTADNEGQIIEEYIKTGKVLLEFHFLPLSQGSVIPMAAGYCAAEQDAFWPYQQKLFAVQAQAIAKTGPALSVAFSLEQVVAYATALGMDEGRFRACLPADATLQAIEDDARAAQAYGFSGTPSFVLDGKPLTNGYPPNFAGWKKLLDSALAGK